MSSRRLARNITIDGCSTVCARKSLELIGVNPKP
ncbi:MAG: hypothetical protein KBI28_02910 [Syntrophaceae bacterium]|nr:hypothetical protein [Syntrophaceae bacterium]MBP8608334.1 hypothetical protein [Syntrophaceae bacterium]